MSPTKQTGVINIKWLATKLEKLVEIFCPRILQLRAVDSSPDADANEIDINNEADPL